MALSKTGVIVYSKTVGDLNDEAEKEMIESEYLAIEDNNFN